MSWLIQYDNTPGSKKKSPSTWPQESKIKQQDGYQLLLFAHPHCPCTNASFEELKEIMKMAPNLSALIVFMVPEEGGDQWLNTSRWKNAQKIPNVSLFADLGAKEAKTFGADTSGHVLLYGPMGDLLFSGGITIARGHIGNNPGRESILAHISRVNNSYNSVSTPVFGCSLTGE